MPPLRTPPRLLVGGPSRETGAGPYGREGTDVATEDPRPNTPRRQLVRQLKELRTGRGLSLDEAGLLIGVSRMTIKRTESLKGAVNWRRVDALCRAYGAGDDVRKALVAMAQKTNADDWWTEYSDALPEQITPLIMCEWEAAREENLCTTYFPGLLQVPEYAAAVLRAAEIGASPAEIIRKTEARMRRQKVLSREPALELGAIIDESVLHRWNGDPAVMAAQIAHVREAARSPKITVQILPHSTGAHAADSSAFLILRSADPSMDVVHVSTLTGALYMERAEDLERYGAAWEQLRAQALGPIESDEMMAAVGEQFASAAR